MRFVAPVLALLTFGCGSGAGAPNETALVVAPTVPRSPPAVAPSPEAVETPPATDAPANLARDFRDRLLSTADANDPGAALFQQAHERELASDVASARRTYFELIRNYPQSPLVPYAYLAFADLFLEEALRDDPSKYELAKQAYSEVVKYPPPANQAFAYAWHRLGIVRARMGDGPGALNAQKKAIDATTHFGTAPLAREIGEAARREMVGVDPETGRPAWPARSSAPPTQRTQGR